MLWWREKNSWNFDHGLPSRCRSWGDFYFISSMCFVVFCFFFSWKEDLCKWLMTSHLKFCIIRCFHFARCFSFFDAYKYSLFIIDRVVLSSCSEITKGNSYISLQIIIIVFHYFFTSSNVQESLLMRKTCFKLLDTKWKLLFKCFIKLRWSTYFGGWIWELSFIIIWFAKWNY